MTTEVKKLRGEFFPLLNAFGEAQWQSGRGVPHADIDELGEAVFAFVSRLQSRLDSLEKDAAIVKMLSENQEDGEGLRYGLECFVVDGVNKYTVYDEDESSYLCKVWRLTAREALLEALQSQGATK